MNRKDRFRIVFALLMFSSFIAMIMWLFENVTHTIGNVKLGIITLIISLLSFGIYFYFLKINEKEPMYFGAYIFIAIIFIAYLQPLAFISNRYFGYGDIIENTYPINKINAVHEAPYGILGTANLEIDYYKIWFKVGEKEHKLNLDAEYKSCIIEDELKLPIRRGLWGFDQVILK